MYTLLKESVFKDKNTEVAKVLLMDCLLEEDKNIGKKSIGQMAEQGLKKSV